uniref:Uncharacterized protein n=1 Tax=Rhizophora mucronata TaxID=61149 RepID=A0A2P2MRW6_RHIMU
MMLCNLIKVLRISDVTYLQWSFAFPD